MKTKKLSIILLMAVLLVVYYLWGMGYLKQRKAHEALLSQTAEAAQTLVQMPRPDDLEQRLATARASLDTVKNSFPSRMNSTEIVNAVLKLADSVGVKAIPLVTKPWTTEDLSGHSYAVFRFNVAVTGTLTQLTSFLSQLENGEPKTLIVEDVSVTRVTETSGTEGAPEGTIPVNASLDLAIYCQPPATE